MWHTPIYILFSLYKLIWQLHNYKHIWSNLPTQHRSKCYYKPTTKGEHVYFLYENKNKQTATETKIMHNELGNEIRTLKLADGKTTISELDI